MTHSTYVLKAVFELAVKCQNVTLYFFLTFLRERIIDIQVGWYHMVPYPFRLHFLVTDEVPALKCRIKCFSCQEFLTAFLIHPQYTDCPGASSWRESLLSLVGCIGRVLERTPPLCSPELWIDLLCILCHCQLQSSHPHQCLVLPVYYLINFGHFAQVHLDPLVLHHIAHCPLVLFQLLCYIPQNYPHPEFTCLILSCLSWVAVPLHIH